MRADQAAGALRNVTVSKAVNIDKASVIRDRPTSITAHVDVQAILKRLEAQGVIEMDAVELPDDDIRELSAPNYLGPCDG